VPAARVHHLNCATLCPRGSALIDGRGGLTDRARLVCHVLLVETARGLLLVDTGLGSEDLASPLGRLGAGFLAMLGPRLDPAETAARQIQARGRRAGEVTDILVTHLDADHAGGLGDFPGARVHLRGAELDALEAPRTRYEKVRYRKAQFRHRPRWVRHDEAGEDWFGFRAVRALDEAEPDVLLVPLDGHSRGHSGVAVRTAEGWLLHCGDAYFHHGEMEEPPHCPPGLLAVQRLDDYDHRARVENQRRLRALRAERRTDLRLFCAHDAIELARYR
jgi:glyoxylase-like metal-dependent hydrolase (beta-lactamase superfamily II)